MPAEQITIETLGEPETGTEILRLTGPLTLNTLFDFQQALRAATSQKTIIDLTGVPYMDSAGLGAVLSFHVSCGRHAQAYALAGVAPRIFTMLQVAHVDNLLHLFGTVREAEAFLAR